MAEFEYRITDPAGIHARPAAALVKKIRELGCRVTVCKGERCADASGVMGVMALGIRAQDTIRILVEPEEAQSQIRQFFEENF